MKRSNWPNSLEPPKALLSSTVLLDAVKKRVETQSKNSKAGAELRFPTLSDRKPPRARNSFETSGPRFQILVENRISDKSVKPPQLNT